MEFILNTMTIVCRALRPPRRPLQPALVSFAVGIMLAVSVSAPCSANESISGVSETDLSNWEDSLRNAGASPAEVSQLEQLLRDMSSQERADFVNYLKNAPPTFFVSYLTDLRREAQEPAPAPIASATPAHIACNEMRNASVPNTTIDDATIDPQDASCRVTATVTHPPGNDRVTVWIALPTTGWNGRFRGTGGGGYSGGSKTSLRALVHRGYAAGATDAGHEGSGLGFVLNDSRELNWQEIRDFAYLGIHDMTVVGKSLTQTFYRRAARYSYFYGGSTGGRQALVEAQRYPADYDGIVAEYPAISMDRLVPFQSWPALVMLEANDPIPKTKLDAVTAAAVAACDGIDGVIDDPAHCTYDPLALVGTKIGDSTFSEVDARVVRSLWEGPRAHDGSFLWYGLMRGADLSGLSSTGESAWIQYLLIQNPAWDWKTLTRGEFELLFNQSAEEYGTVIGSDNPDLARFRDHGGKLIITHGLADQYEPTQATIDYYKRVQQRSGGPKRAAEFARLFLVPGADHGYGNAAPRPTDMEGVIIRWVEGAKPPERIIAELRDPQGKLVRTRPLFPYPQIAKYKGRGSTDDAANFFSDIPKVLASSRVQPKQ
jgi:hypothetical protein